MPILGIDYEKCINCGTCLTACPLFARKNKNKVVFRNIQDFCNLCGHCIGKCPENAILYEDMGEALAYEGVDKTEKIASFDTVLKMLRANRSIRLYKKQKVPTDLLKKVFEAMSHAPTGGNMRSERFSILSDKEKIKKLSDAVIEELLKDPQMSARYKMLFSILEKTYYSPVFFDAPHVIFVSSSLNWASVSNNIGIIITYGRLGAQALGLGTCWNGLVQVAMLANPEMKKLVGIRGKRIGCFIIGYPDEIYHRSPPRSIKKVAGLEE